MSAAKMFLSCFLALFCQINYCNCYITWFGMFKPAEPQFSKNMFDFPTYSYA